MLLFFNLEYRQYSSHEDKKFGGSRLMREPFILAVR